MLFFHVFLFILFPSSLLYLFPRQLGAFMNFHEHADGTCARSTVSKEHEECSKILY